MVHMELLLLLSPILFATLVTSQSPPPGGYYHTKYDHLDVEDVLNHKRLVHHYAKCLLSRGPCPPEGADLKRILPEALETNCLRCTGKQKFVVYHTIKRLRKEFPDLWKEVADLWDPTGDYIRTFEATFENNKEISSTSTTTASPNAIDQSPNLLSNRFSEDDTTNDLVPTNQRPYPPTMPHSSVSVTSGVSSASLNPSPAPSSPASVSSSPSVPPTFSTLFPSSVSSSTAPTPQPSAIYPAAGVPPIRWWITTPTATKGVPPVSNWRPTTQNLFFRPQPVTRPVLPILTVDGVKILGSISDIGSKVLQAGSQVAGMVFSTVQALVGRN